MPMSIEATSWALNVPIGGNAKVILLGLANHAHPDGTESYPSLNTLARYAHCDRSTARRNVRKLVADGWAKEAGTGPNGQTKYSLPVGRVVGGGILPRGELPPVPDDGQGGGIAMPPEPSIEPSLPTVCARDDEIPEGFPSELRPHARVVMVALREAAVERGANAVTVRGVGRAVMDFPRRPLVLTAVNLRSWLLDGAGRNKPCKDILRRYRDWLRDAPDLAATERLADDGTPASDAAGHPPGVTPIGRRHSRDSAKAEREAEREAAAHRVVAARQAQEGTR